MTIKDWIRNKLMKFLKLEKLSESPNDERLTFISNDEDVKIDEIRANRIWYVGNGNELLNFYTQRSATGFSDNPIYNRNKRNYFWSLSASECDIKRIHSGIPNAIIGTISNVVGIPNIEDETGIWDKIAEENDFYNKLAQQARPLALAEGYGAWKVNVNPGFSKLPLIEYYDAEYVEYIYKCGSLIGIMFKSYYKDSENRNYVLIETRYKDSENSYIDYDLFRLNRSNEIEKVDLDTIPELCDIPRETQVIKGFNKITAVPLRYFYDPQNPKYGQSIYAGKLDLFDMLDEVLSQASQTNRVSTPVEYYNPDVLDRSGNGFSGTPHLYNRQYVEKTGVPDGDGNLSNDIITTQPDLNFDKYMQLASNILDYIFTGRISPATLGIDVAKKDNADAQREKEKVTMFTRTTIINAETRALRDLVSLCIMLQEYMNTTQITLQDYNINVTYSEFANPSFENQIQILGQAWVQGEISTEKYVDLLWADKISDEEKQKEIEWLDSNKQQDTFDMEGMLDNVQGTEQDVPAGGNEEEIPTGITE